MQGQSKESNFQDTVLKQAVSHPRRLEMLGFLAGKKTGIDEVELAEALGLNLPLVKYHLGVLCSADMVAHAENSKSGTIDRYVAVAGRPVTQGT
jgi:predicted ArsR family transcriptional regulator